MKGDIYGKNDILGEFEDRKKSPSRVVSGAKYFTNYILLTAIIFALLLVSTNFESYWALARDIINPGELVSKHEKVQNALSRSSLSSQASGISLEDEKNTEKLARFLEKHLARQKVAVKYKQYSAKNFDHLDSAPPAVDVEITPYDNRIVLPKIAKNIPLVNVENYQASDSYEWHKIFMKELAGGVIKYPGSANPGQVGNSFIFGHSSNFPWAEGEYNDVFALLDKLEEGDEMIAYNDQKKYVYTVKQKRIVRPGFVDAIEGSEDKKMMTLMTCWPVGTTLNRLLVIGELEEVSEENASELADNVEEIEHNS